PLLARRPRPRLLAQPLARLPRLLRERARALWLDEALRAQPLLAVPHALLQRDLRLVAQHAAGLLDRDDAALGQVGDRSTAQLGVASQQFHRATARLGDRAGERLGKRPRAPFAEHARVVREEVADLYRDPVADREDLATRGIRVRGQQHAVDQV